MMKMVNRSALIIRPKEPYIRWAAGLDEQSRRLAQGLEETVSVYLLPTYEMNSEIEPLLRRFAKTVFEAELDAWHTDPSDWPKRRGYRELLKWFDVSVESMVVDLDSVVLEHDW